MSKVKNSFLIVSCLLIVSLLVGCSGSGKSETEAAKKGAGKAELRFSWWGNDARHEATLKVIVKYMEKNPNVKIEAEYSGKSDREKIATQIAGGTVADLVQLNPPWMSGITANGDFFVDLESKKGLLDMSGFNKQFVDSYGIYNGKLIALPTGVNARVTLMNKTTAEQYKIPTGLDAKWTWEDLDAIGKTVNAKSKDRYFLNANTRTLGTFVLRPYIQQQTGEQFIKDDKTLGFTKDQLAAALRYIERLYDHKVLQPVAEANVFMDVTSTNPKWILGDIVAEFMWTSQMTGASKDVRGETVAFVMPMHPNAKTSALTVQPAQLLAVSNKSKSVDEAVKFMNYFFNDLEAGKILRDHRSIPPVEKVREACLQDKLLDPKVLAGVSYGLANSGAALNAPSSGAEIEKIVTDAIETAAYKKKPIDKIAEDAIALMNDVLKASKKK